MQQVEIGIKISLSTAREFLQFNAKLCTTCCMHTVLTVDIQLREMILFRFSLSISAYCEKLMHIISHIIP